MKPLDCTPFTPEQFQQLAMYKARGYAWPDIAAYVKMPVENIERVAWTHEKQWNRTLTKAEQIVARETISEMAACLRNDLRHAEAKLRPTLANSLTRILKQQQDFAPKKRRRPKSPPLPPPPVAAPEVAKPVEAPKPPPDLPPPTPKMSTDEMIALKKRIRSRIAGAACALLAFVCLCALWFSRVSVNSSPTFGPAMLLTDHAPFVATAPPDNEQVAPPLAASWRAPPTIEATA